MYGYCGLEVDNAYILILVMKLAADDIGLWRLSSQMRRRVIENERMSSYKHMYKHIEKLKSSLLLHVNLNWQYLGSDNPLEKAQYGTWFNRRHTSGTKAFGQLTLNSEIE